MIPVGAEYFTKVIVFAVILRLLRVFDMHSFLMYVIFSTAYFFWNPMLVLPELLITSIFVFLFSYVIIYSVRNAVKTGPRRFMRHMAGLFYKKSDMFYSVFIFSFVIMNLGISNWFVIFFGSFFGFLLISWLTRKKNHSKLNTYGVVSYFNVAFACVLWAYYSSHVVAIVSSIIIGFVYLTLFVVYSVVSDTFTFECPVDGLKEGMISTEYVLKKNGRYYKKSFQSITPQSFLRGRIQIGMDREHVVVSPLKALSPDVIDLLRKVRNDAEFGTLSVQKTVDMRLFVVLGIVFVIALRMYFVIA